MSSPPRDSSVALSSSPISINLGAAPLRRRSTSPEHADLVSRPRHSPTHTRSFDPNDPQVRERQRTMDVDMAMQLSRARRETLHSSPTNASFEPQPPPSPEIAFTLPSLSRHEEREINIARGRDDMQDVGLDIADDETISAQQLLGDSSLAHLDPHLHQTPSDPNILLSLDGQSSPPHQLPQGHEDMASSRYGLPTYQANVSQSNFDFAKMEDFAAEEKRKLGFSSPVTARFNLDQVLRGRRPTSDNVATSSNERPTVVQLGPPPTEIGNLSPSPPLQDALDSIISSPMTPAPITGIFDEGSSTTTPTKPLRHRKLSQSNPHPRTHRKGIGGKMAMFESNAGEPLHSLSARLGIVLGGAGSSTGGPDHFPSHGHQTGGIPGILNTGHDRPFRFSFYSNALSATIHARSLSELPAERQTFKDLFSGIHPPPSPDLRRESNGVNSANLDSTGFRRSGFSDAKNGNSGMSNGNGDTDATTWWLDVTSPTEEEMKMLSQVFSIHPLTTEDILMEETREKIELFRNYYFVCFRSFEQDQYSPTYLEPLNMYIIVFREGILSFHFQPTPHPQNVRRRIKQFKDYISVTSDWISYAIIDDITDAFGPLIQGIEYEVDSIDELVLILKEAEQSDMLRRIGTCRKKVMGLLRLMGNKADVVKGLAKRCNENWRVAPTSDIGLYLSDIQDHLITMTQNLNHYEKILSRSHSNYLAQISIEMTDANNQINDVLSKLTALGTVLIPMNLVTGLWGMNVHVPGQDVPGYAWFVSIIACLAAFAAVGGYSTYKFMVRK
ncbi:hypothetical protein AMATHDRAFT_76276 [Amanita thiersii Skay4041]|uniref:Cora-domain-containing protein n=1 Tax=Amanita thiersii Skay4041 TaxID=703135 RepID=A0A2A9NLP5_9AGAR|nr:hypothetical protein AMATHDRAFT_76276 [Amanita thiersii Skay4041]